MQILGFRFFKFRVQGLGVLKSMIQGWGLFMVQDPGLVFRASQLEDPGFRVYWVSRPGCRA